MVKQQEKSQLPHSKKDKPPSISSIEEEKFMAIMRQIGDTSMDNLSSDHIDEVLRQRSQITEYIHKENMQEHERFKIAMNNSLIQIILLLGFASLILILVAFVDKAYLPNAITAIIAFLGGIGIGRGMKEVSKK